MDWVYNVLFYGVIIVMGALFIGLTIYRIDWARHPEKYAKDVEEAEKADYWRKKKREQEAAEKKAKDKQKALKRQKRVDKLNHLREINGKKPAASKEKGKK